MYSSDTAFDVTSKIIMSRHVISRHVFHLFIHTHSFINFFGREGPQSELRNENRKLLIWKVKKQTDICGTHM
jgi:hypothetical protein